MSVHAFLSRKYHRRHNNGRIRQPPACDVVSARQQQEEALERERKHAFTFGVEGPVGSVVVVQVDPLLLAQPAHLLVELPGDVGVSGGDCPGDALGSEEAVDLWRRCEDAVVGSGAEDEPHVGLGQVEVARGEEDAGVRPRVRQQALRSEESGGKRA